MAGRSRKPTKMKLIHGTFRKDRMPENEPEPERLIEVPRPPSYLTKYAKKLWKSLAAELVEHGILTKIDTAALEACCEAYGQYRAAHEAVFRPRDPETGKLMKRTLAEYMKGRNSQTMPEYTSMMKAFNTFKTYMIEFGLTPASRGRIDIPKSPEAETDTMKRLYHEA
jgi:P27 family predicted phage terminase small subunit